MSPVTAPAAIASPAASSPAASILAEAHKRSNSAKTEQDYSDIVELCRQSQEAQPTEEVSLYASNLAAWALNRRGQLHAEAGRNDEAMCDFDIAIEADAKCWRAVHNRGVLLAQAGEFEDAFNDFARTIDINPKFPKAYSNRAALFVVAGDIELAKQDYARAVELDPQMAVAHRGLARCCHLNKDLEASLEHYDEAVRLSPNDAFAIASRADVMTDLGQYTQAATEYERAISIDPKSSHAHHGAAWLLATCPDEAVRNPQLAIERAQTALQLADNQDAASLDTLAAAQANAGDFAAAIKSIEQAVVLANDSQRDAFEARLTLYQQQQPYRSTPLERVTQTSLETTIK